MSRGPPTSHSAHRCTRHRDTMSRAPVMKLEAEDSLPAFGYWTEGASPAAMTGYSVVFDNLRTKKKNERSSSVSVETPDASSSDTLSSSDTNFGRSEPSSQADSWSSTTGHVRNANTSHGYVSISNMSVGDRSHLDTPDDPLFPTIDIDAIVAPQCTVPQFGSWDDAGSHAAVTYSGVFTQYKKNRTEAVTPPAGARVAPPAPSQPAYSPASTPMNSRGTSRSDEDSLRTVGIPLSPSRPATAPHPGARESASSAPSPSWASQMLCRPRIGQPTTQRLPPKVPECPIVSLRGRERARSHPQGRTSTTSLLPQRALVGG